MNRKRRDLLILGGVVALIYGLRAVPWGQMFGRGPQYVEIEDLPPFRRLAELGPTSAFPPALAGLDAADGDADLRRERADAVRNELCSALFGVDGPAGIIPVAYFSDFQCPYCRVLERDLGALLADDPTSFRLVQHELPIFGAASELAARASVAAARQGKQQDLRRRFMRLPLVADDTSVLQTAADIGIDADRLARDMTSSDVQGELDRSRALADVFGFIGTPGLVIGTTVLNGAVPASLLKSIMEDEKSLGPPRC